MAKSSTRRVTIYINGKEAYASGWQTFSYGKLGEVTENIRTFALPFESKPYTFRMKYKYDSFNRMQQMTYPDGEVVSYGYDLGGMLNSIEGDKNGQNYPYVKHIAYNRYELKDSVLYGNGSFTTYDYDNLMRLAHLQSFTGAAAELMQDITYDYDAVSNITHIGNQATMLGCGLGGTYESSYTYDNLYRLSSAGGNWDNGTMTNTYVLSMGYHPNGRIAKKLLQADVLDHLGSITTKDYDNLYSYPDGRNTLEKTEDQRSSQWQYFKWDNAGNMTMHRLHDECTRRLCWDEENRLQGVADCSYASLYQYDANGERTYKLTGQYSYQNINGRYYPYAVLENPTLYASPYVVCTPKGYTKHYYAESERVASKIGNGCLRDLCKSLNTDADFNREDEPENPYLIDCGEVNEVFKRKMERNYLLGKKIMECTSANNFNVESKLGKLYERIGCINEKEKECYWYHPDHLGSSSWITDVNGKPVQHLHYLPWGEDFVDQRSTNWNALFTFSAKERDVETGLSYFGARYYSSDLSIWLSVDPMSDKYPSTSPYAYCRNNPVILVDPNGNKDKPYNAKRDKPISIQSGTETFISKTTGFGKVLSYSKKSQQNAYNCHSYAWHNSKGDPTPQKGDIPTAVFSGGLTRWDNSPADDIKEQKAQQLGVDDNNVPGDIVIYYSDANKNNQYDDGEFISHSAVVKTVDEEGNTQTVIGKLGQDGISENHPDAPGYYQEAENPNTGKIEKQSRAYFRISATND